MAGKKPMAPQTPAHMKREADMAERRAKAVRDAAESKKKNDAYEAMKLNNRLNRGKKSGY